ncbi:MAG: glycosyltransferase [Holophagales bacterium]|nr:glycosyltransferase [Holophagales bacterium]
MSSVAPKSAASAPRLARPVTIVILAWNRWPLTRRCLESLRTHTDLEGVEVLVVDNGSTDETPARLAEYPWLKTIRNGTNLGFVRGNNVGIAAARPGSDVVLLNNDLEIPQHGWLDRLAACAHSAPDVGVVGCRLVMPDGRFLHAGTYVLPDTVWGQQIGSNETNVGQFAGDRTVEGIVFACAYIKREALDAVGGLSEDFESYFEDTDYCLRAREAGFRTVCCGGVTLVHEEHGSTATDPAFFESLFHRSRGVFEKKWKPRLEARYTRSLSWQSILNFSTGYAMSSRELLRALDAEGVRASYSYIYGPGSPFPLQEPANSGDYLLNVVAGRHDRSVPDVGVVYGQGDVFQRGHGRQRIGYTMLEVDGFPAEWVRQANLMDEVWVPSHFNREGLLSCGVTRPVQVMPLGVDVDHFHPGIKSVPNPKGDFVFLSNFEWGERKQPELLLTTFNRVFRRSDPVVLLCKVINRDPGVRVRELVSQLNLSPYGGRIAFVYNHEFPYHQLGVLYRSADCYVTAGRGEGWDMPLMEAMACGLPSIATDWGAHTEFVHDGISYPLKVKGTVRAVAKCPYYTGFSWADPDPDHLAHLLRHVFENPDEAAAKGRAATEEMHAKWTWRHAARRIVERVETLRPSTR